MTQYDSFQDAYDALDTGPDNDVWKAIARTMTTDALENENDTPHVWGAARRAELARRDRWWS